MRDSTINIHYLHPTVYVNYIDLLNSNDTDGWLVANVSNNFFVNNAVMSMFPCKPIYKLPLSYIKVLPRVST